MSAMGDDVCAPRSLQCDFEVLSEKFASFVKANPGLRIEQINKELGTTTKDLALPIRKLIVMGWSARRDRSGQRRTSR
jgi:hypothetical protein